MSEMLDTSFHERRRAERMRDPEFRAAYEQAASQARCICSGCNRPSDPRPVGTAPDGWVKLSSLRGSVVYRCPECKEGRG